MTWVKRQLNLGLNLIIGSLICLYEWLDWRLNNQETGVFTGKRRRHELHAQ